MFLHNLWFEKMYLLKNGIQMAGCQIKKKTHFKNVGVYKVFFQYNI